MISLFYSTDCLLNLDSGRTSVGVVSAEEAFLATPLTSNIVVIGEKHTGIVYPYNQIIQVKY